MDQATSSDIAAAAAVHRELGRDYDDALAQGLVDRIGAEIDKRVDARLRTGSPESAPPARPSQSGKIQALLIGSGISGVVAIVAEHGSHKIVDAMIVVWVILAVVGLATAVVNRYRITRRG